MERHLLRFSYLVRSTIDKPPLLGVGRGS
ncbi:MAG: hypothetical protein FD130_784, partial [Halothiobacillaceae bacterium]